MLRPTIAQVSGVMGLDVRAILAEAYFAVESALVPDDARPVIVEATILREHGQLQPALAAANRAVAIESENARALALRNATDPG